MARRLEIGVHVAERPANQPHRPGTPLMSKGSPAKCRIPNLANDGLICRL
jgi:hypothetical protein